MGKGGGTGKSWHKPRIEMLCEARKGQGTAALEPLELQNPSLLGGAAEDRPHFILGVPVDLIMLSN